MKIKFPIYKKDDKLSEYFSYWIENPYHTWKKAKQYFKKPKIKIGFFRSIYNCCPYASLNNVAKILDIQVHDVDWKDKWNSPRHERSPYIWICFFKKFGINIKFHITYDDEFGIKRVGDMYYWEYLLEWLYYKDKKTLKCYSEWESDSRIYTECVKRGEAEDGSEDVFKPYKILEPVVSMSLNKNGIQALKNELNITYI